ncbi:response regulator [Thiohalomonas denitrificans]|uniref:response regulator n=1 Tax=Thiohalomonas denitrificans TaxID=415747 RepID=UPI0026EC5215|nr:response regulator [Thiohalomonas denitrificans]
MPDKHTVLIVDDSRTVRATIRKHLSNEFTIVEAEDGEAGWEALQQNPDITLIISDIQMPRLDGYGFICRIRAANEGNIRNNPIIVITGAEDEITRERAYACGANDYILKPLDFTDLVTRLKSQVDANMEGRSHIAQDMKKYESSIEDTVLEAPDIGRAIKVIKGEDSGNIDPYIIDLCLEAMPLFEYLNELSIVDIEEEVASIRTKLESQLLGTCRT